MTRFSLIALLVFAALSVSAQQPPAQQPTFRTGANYVRVDMYATKDGKPVDDLKQSDVDILEDGVLQQVDTFEHVRVRTAPEDARLEPNTIADSRRMAADPRARVFVIFLDTYHTQIDGSANMRQPLINFLNRALGPDDMVAVMTPEMAATEVTFGRKTTVLSKMLEQETFWGRRGRLVDDDDREDLYKACYGPSSPIGEEMKARRREKLTLDALEDLMIHLAGLRDERKAILTVTEGWKLYTKSTTLEAGDAERRVNPGDVLFRPPVPRPTDAAQTQGSPRVQCEADRMALAQIDHQLRLRELTQLANRGNVTFYPVYARGLVAFDGSIGDNPPGTRGVTLQEDAANLKARHDSLRFLADDTDGVSIINTNNIDGMLRRIVDDLSSYYLLGYYTTNTKLDGRFRAISVRLKRPGVTVRARKGYRGYTAEEVSRGTSSSAAPSSAAPVTAALTPVVSFNARAQFRIRASAWGHQTTSGATEGALWVVGELDPQTRKQSAWSTGVEAEVALVGAEGQQVATRKIDVKPNEGAFLVQLPDAGGVPPGDYTVRVRLRSPVEGELGLTDMARVTVKEEGLGEAIVWRRGASTGPQYVRTADPRFLRSDRIRLELASTDTRPVAARLVDRNGTAMTVQPAISERPDASGQFRWIVVEIALAPFAPGDYAIETAQGPSRRLTAFRIVP
jgi:VWFA-related protein